MLYLHGYFIFVIVSFNRMTVSNLFVSEELLKNFGPPRIARVVVG